MAVYKLADQSVVEMAADILCGHADYKPLLEAKVKIDYVMAFAKRDPDTGEVLGNAITHNGRPALGLCKKVNLKDRVKGMGDVEIQLDGDNWEKLSPRRREAILAHEIHHIMVKVDKRGIMRDDAMRPLIELREHDVEVGWFAVIAKRYGLDSEERQQANNVMADFDQAFFPWYELNEASRITEVGTVASLFSRENRGSLFSKTQQSA